MAMPTHTPHESPCRGDGAVGLLAIPSVVIATWTIQPMLLATSSRMPFM